MRLTTLLLLPLFATAARADILSLNDGRVFEDVKLERSTDGVSVLFKNGKVTVPNHMVRATIFDDSPDTYEPRDEKEREMLEKGKVFFEGKWVSKKTRDRAIEKEIEAKREEVEYAKKTSNWRDRHIEETDHFIFESTVPKHVFARYRDLMEAYYDEFVKSWKIKPPRGLPKLKVCFYIDQENFYQVSGAPRGVLGFFRFVEPMELNIFYDRLDPAFTEQVMYHEAGHYLHKLIDMGFKMPHFPGESVAEYYGASRFDSSSKKLETGLILDWRLLSIKRSIALDEWIPINDLLTKDINEDYSWGWSLVHYLMNDKRYESKFKKFFVGLAKAKNVDRSKGAWNLDTVTGKNVREAFMDFLDIRNDDALLELQSDWYKYIDEELEVKSARGLEQAAFNALKDGRTIRAKRLFQEATEGTLTGRSGSLASAALTHYRYSELLYDEKDYDTAWEHMQKAIELDPLTGEYYVGYGRTLLSKGKNDDMKYEGIRILNLAEEIEPDHRWLERNKEAWIEKFKPKEQTEAPAE